MVTSGDLAVGGDAAWSRAGHTSPNGKTFSRVEVNKYINNVFQLGLSMGFLKPHLWAGRWRWPMADRSQGSSHWTDTDHTCSSMSATMSSVINVINVRNYFSLEEVPGAYVQSWAPSPGIETIMWGSVIPAQLSGEAQAYLRCRRVLRGQGMTQRTTYPVEIAERKIL